MLAVALPPPDPPGKRDTKNEPELSKSPKIKKRTVNIVSYGENFLRIRSGVGGITIFYHLPAV